MANEPKYAVIEVRLPAKLGEVRDLPIEVTTPVGGEVRKHSAGNLGNLKVRGEMRPDTILDGELSDLPYRGHYRICRYVESDGDEATIAGGATVKTRLPFGSFVLVERVAEKVG